MLIKAILLVTAIFLTQIAHAGKPHPRDSLYYSAMVVEALDGITTDRAIKAGGKEVGYLAVRLIGEKPTAMQILAMTLAKMGVVEGSRRWSSNYKNAYQWSVMIVRIPVIHNNRQVEIAMSKKFK